MSCESTGMATEINNLVNQTRNILHTRLPRHFLLDLISESAFNFFVPIRHIIHRQSFVHHYFVFNCH